MSEFRVSRLNSQKNYQIFRLKAKPDNKRPSQSLKQLCLLFNALSATFLSSTAHLCVYVTKNLPKKELQNMAIHIVGHNFL